MRANVKCAMWRRDAALRRRELIRKQQKTERAMSNEMRRLVSANDSSDMDVVDTKNEHISKQKTREERLKARKAYYSKQFMLPEWMHDIPKDLDEHLRDNEKGWYVFPRPEGKRCLVIAHNGITLARTMSGSVLRRFPSALPSGSHRTSGKMYSIFDCIFQESDGDEVFYIIDILCWKGYMLYNCTLQFRRFWLGQKLEEVDSVHVKTPSNIYRFECVPSMECNATGLEMAYRASFPFIKDGLLFAMKEAQYEFGLSPCALLWKDSAVSRYLSFDGPYSVVLSLECDGRCVALENVALCAVDSSQTHDFELTAGDLLRFTYKNLIITENSQVILENLQFQRRCSPERALPDSLSKLIFNANKDRIQFQDILQSLSTTSYIQY